VPVDVVSAAGCAEDPLERVAAEDHELAYKLVLVLSIDLVEGLLEPRENPGEILNLLRFHNVADDQASFHFAVSWS